MGRENEGKKACFTDAMTENPVKRDVGPDYVPKEEKPTATISTDIAYDNVLILPQTPQLIALMTYVPTNTNTRKK